jgi:glyoxylase-like metal-dependent hydrolase (beta-lactamase superfamily II)
MVIKDPPVQVSSWLLMLGTKEYPVYLAKGTGESAIFEAGISATAGVVSRQLRQFDIKAEAVKRLVVTHAHPDHVMGVEAFRDAFGGIEVVASKTSKDVMSNEKAVAFFSKVDAVVTESLLGSGSIIAEDRSPKATQKTIAVDRVVKEGDKIEADELAFDVLETPGHSECSLSFYEANKGILIISDATGYYLPEQNYFWPNYFTGYSAYMDSMRRLAGIKTEILCLSHNAVIKGTEAVKAYFEGAINATENYHKRIVRESQGGAKPAGIAKKLGAEVYEKTQLMGLDFFEKNCELLVKQSLKHEKKAGSK